MASKKAAQASSVRTNKRMRDDVEKSYEIQGMPNAKRTKLDVRKRVQTRQQTAETRPVQAQPLPTNRKRARNESDDNEEVPETQAKRTKFSKRELKQLRQQNARKMHSKRVRKTPGGLVDLNMKLEQNPALSAIVIQNQLNSPFLRLPGEIRNQIYNELLSERVIKINRGKMHKNHQQWGTRVYGGQKIDHATRPAPAATLALLSTCRQIYYETATTFYRSNTFSFDTEKDMMDWAPTLQPAQLGAIQTIQAGLHFTHTVTTRTITFSTPTVSGMTPAHLVNVTVLPGSSQRPFSRHLPGVKHVIARDPGCGSNALTRAIITRDSNIQKVTVIPQ
ncbi:hypothetical protein BDV96DRAFT_643637 [Lophiotrema nucula]|uniref:DUF7730 domain-containing protein n=1 Tax=Lophiotrema nucula TaxID=690887 RepID=A0A6A5ZFX0_9PLEO|nr:hypothetical protein BDV96DRAFT_643637 [Lophiotrema nucula]